MVIKKYLSRYMSWYKDHKNSNERPTDSAMYKLTKQGTEVTKRKRRKRLKKPKKPKKEGAITHPGHEVVNETGNPIGSLPGSLQDLDRPEVYD